MIKQLKALAPDWAKAIYHKQQENRIRQRMLSLHSAVLPYEAGLYPPGINLIGNIRSETGLGESMRILARVLKENGIPFVIVNTDRWANADNGIHDWDDYIVEEPQYHLNLIHINAGDWMRYYCDFPKNWLDGRYNVAYWLWELETFPERWRACIDTLDAIWAPSQFICDCLQQYTKKPVIHVPYAIDLQMPVEYARKDFVLPENQFLYLLMYDFRSVSERKNPKGAVEAFKRAFTAEEANRRDIGIVLKINNAATQHEISTLKKELVGYENIYFFTENMSRSKVESLIADVDVLISLHRAEGFGLPIAEAMYLGTPTVATNWSANSEFMDASSSCPVGGQFVELMEQIGPYEKGNRWMDADIDEAAGYIRRLYEDKDYYQSILEHGQEHIREVLSYKRAGDQIRSQM